PERREGVDVVALQELPLEMGADESLVEQLAQPTLRPSTRGEVQAFELPRREDPCPRERLEDREVPLVADPCARGRVRPHALRELLGHGRTQGSRTPTPQTSHTIQPAPAPQIAQRPTQPWYVAWQLAHSKRPVIAFGWPFGQESVEASARRAPSARRQSERIP